MSVEPQREDDPTVPPGTLVGGPRPVLVATSGAEVVGVTLEHRGRRVVGECAVTADRDQATACAAATLDAVAALTPAAVEIAVAWCGVVEPAGQPPAALSFTTVTVAGVALPQVGSALLHDGLLLAAARATLDSVNRRLEIMGM